jgi:glycosyltransferase involved in cell wall biosynthesis
MIAGRTILCFASGYDAPPTSKHHVMHLLAEQNVVLWVGYHASRTPAASSSDIAWIVHKLRQVFAGLRQARPNLYVLTPLALPLPGSRLARAINRRLILWQIRRALRRIAAGPLEVWSFAPDIAYLLDGLDARRVIYYCVDDFAHFSGYDAGQILADEAALARRADLQIVTSQALLESKKSLNPNTLLLPHGVDATHFARALEPGLAEPAELADIPHPRLGFFGLIRDWVDLDLLVALAQRRAEWQIVLLGDSTVDLTACRTRPNIHLLGPKPYAELPAWCAGFDVGLIPFRLNELTRAVNPIKLREYLAAGLPVVSTPLPEVARYGSLVHLAEGVDAFEAAIAAALAEPADRRAARSQAMQAETWPARMNQIAAACKDSPSARPDDTMRPADE